MILLYARIEIFNTKLPIYVDGFIEPTLTRYYIKLEDFMRVINFSCRQIILDRFAYSPEMRESDLTKIYTRSKTGRVYRTWYLTIDGAITLAKLIPVKVRTYMLVYRLEEFKSAIISQKKL